MVNALTVSPRMLLGVNSGSSSLKVSAFLCTHDSETKVVEGAIEGIGLASGRLWIRNLHDGTQNEQVGTFASSHDALGALWATWKRGQFPAFEAVGHRFVHGGPDYVAPTLVTEHVLTNLATFTPFAPLHLPSAIEAVRAVQKQFPQLPHVVCFDTGFHRNLPAVARRFPLPETLHQAGVHRYGFHGLSYEYVAETLHLAHVERAVVAHLGSGASLVAVRRGASVDTTMGLTPAGGIMMATRSGDLDPGVLLYLLQSQRYDLPQLERLLNRESGLLAVSQQSSDMKILTENYGHNEACTLAVDLFCYHAKKAVGALTAALGGLDLLVFTGGIGERSALVRSQICQGMEFLGIQLDSEKNATSAREISEPASRCRVCVVETDEAKMLVRSTFRLLFSDATSNGEPLSDNGSNHNKLLFNCQF